MSNITARLVDGEVHLMFRFDPLDVERVKALDTRRWSKTHDAWIIPAEASVVRQAKKFFGDRWRAEQAVEDILNDDLLRQAESLSARLHKKEGTIPIDKVPQDLLSLPLYEHQLKALALGARRDAFGYVMDQGTGKCPTFIADFVWNFRLGEINFVLLFCRNNTKSQWCENDPKVIKACGGQTDELTKFLRPSTKVNRAALYCQPNAFQKQDLKRWRSEFDKQEKDTLHILVANIEVLSVARVYKMLLELVDKAAVGTWVGIDESTKIKAPAKHHKKLGPRNRAAAAIELRWKCKKARIASGTPAIKSPLDLWSQFRFLDQSILPFGSFTSYKMHFAVLGGWGGKQVLFYQNLDELAGYVDGCTYRVMKKDCLDLPDKVYVKHPVEMTSEQWKAYNDMRKHSLVVLNSHRRVLPANDAELLFGERAAGREIYVVEAPIVLTQRLRLQQITAGYMPILEEDVETGMQKQVGIHQLVDPSKNPKIVRSMELIEDSPEEQFIIWVKFHAEAKAHLEALSKMCKVSGFYGGQSPAENDRAMQAFKAGDVRGIIANAQKGGVGTNMQNASMSNYPTNEQSTELRIQSEDRTHRIGQLNKCTYNDIFVPGTVDTLVMAGLRSDRSTSETVMGDDPEDWI